MTPRQRLAQLMVENPSMTNEELTVLARKEGIAPTPHPAIETSKRLWKAATKPVFGEDSYTGMAIPKTGYKAVDVPANILQAMTSPLDLATAATGIGAGVAGAKGLMGLSRAARAAEAVGTGAYGVAGVAQAATAKDPYEAGAGALQAGLSALGVKGALGRSAAKAPSVDVPSHSNIYALLDEQMNAHRANGGSTFNPTKGNMAGQDFYSVGGVVPSEVIPENEFSPEALRSFVSKHQDKLNSPTRSLGTWANEGKVHLDITDLLPKDQAISEAAKRQELAIFGLKNFDEIPTKHVDPITKQVYFGAPPTPPKVDPIQGMAGGPQTALPGQSIADVPKGKGYSAMGETALGIASPTAGMGVQEWARDPETGEVPEWAKLVGVAGNVAGAGALGMAVMRTNQQHPAMQAKRELVSNLFMTDDISASTGASALLQTLSPKDQDRVINRAVATYQKLKAGADPTLFNADAQRRLIEAGQHGNKWYKQSTKGLRASVGKEDLQTFADLIALTSTRATPYHNTNQALTAWSRIRQGLPVEEVVDGMGFAKPALQGYLETGEIPGRKQASFAQNLGGDRSVVTADSMSGAGLGMLPWDPTARIQDFTTKKVRLGGFVGPEQNRNKPEGVQPRGALTQSEYDLAEDTFRKLAPEFGMDPAGAQAAHWASSIKDIIEPKYGRTTATTATHLRDPYNLQLERRFARAGVAPAGQGGRLTDEQLLQIAKTVLLSKQKKTPFK